MAYFVLFSEFVLTQPFSKTETCPVFSYLKCSELAKHAWSPKFKFLLGLEKSAQITTTSHQAAILSIQILLVQCKENSKMTFFLLSGDFMRLFTQVKRNRLHTYLLFLSDKNEISLNITLTILTYFTCC